MLRNVGTMVGGGGGGYLLGPISCKNVNKFFKKMSQNLFLANLANLHIPYGYFTLFCFRLLVVVLVVIPCYRSGKNFDSLQEGCFFTLPRTCAFPES